MSAKTHNSYRSSLYGSPQRSVRRQTRQRLRSLALALGIAAISMAACSETYDEQQLVDATFCLTYLSHAQSAAYKGQLQRNQKNILDAMSAVAPYYQKVDRVVAKQSADERARVLRLMQEAQSRGEAQAKLANESGWPPFNVELTDWCVEKMREL